MKTVFLAIALAGLFIASCAKQPNFQGDDLKMVQAAVVVKKAINNYRFETAELPEEISWCREYLPAGETWPVNPFNGEELADTKSPDFDAATSVGNVYYQKFYRNEVLVGFQLHVFGDKGKLHILGNTAMGIKE